MKRIGQLFAGIAEPDNLRLAFWKAARGKQDRRDVIAFRQDLENNILNMRQQILRHEPDIGHYRFFHVCDPKRRLICAASFAERVLHHAIMNICAPGLESYAIHDSYACRKNKGSHKALARAQNFAGLHTWYLKLDIAKYFDSIDHETVLSLLARRFKDKELLLLFRQLLMTYETAPGKGLPIGNLISQHLANFYLGLLDHWLKEERRIKGYVRYMDDFILFENDKAQLKTELALLTEFLARQLKLRLKDNILLNRCAKGIAFLGYRVFPDRLLLSRRSKQRFIAKFRLYEHRYLANTWTMEELVRHMEPLLGFTQIAAATSFRRQVIDRFGVLS